MSKLSKKYFKMHVTGTDEEKDRAEKWFDRDGATVTADLLRKARKTGDYSKAVAQHNISFDTEDSYQDEPSYKWQILSDDEVNAWKKGEKYEPKREKAAKAPKRRKAREKTAKEIEEQRDRILKEIGRRGLYNNESNTAAGRDDETGKKISKERAKQLEDRYNKVANFADYGGIADRYLKNMRKTGEEKKTASFRVGEYTTGKADEQRKQDWEAQQAAKRQAQRDRRAAKKAAREAFAAERQRRQLRSSSLSAVNG